MLYLTIYRLRKSFWSSPVEQLRLRHFVASDTQMFFGQVLFSRGADNAGLAPIWLAAHWPNKLKKEMVLRIVIESYIERIMNPQVPLALRLRSHLLCGVVRIYQRKMAYLYEDAHKTRKDTFLTRIQQHIAQAASPTKTVAPSAPGAAQDADDAHQADEHDLTSTIGDGQDPLLAHAFDDARGLNDDALFMHIDATVQLYEDRLSAQTQAQRQRLPGAMATGAGAGAGLGSDLSFQFGAASAEGDEFMFDDPMHMEGLDMFGAGFDAGFAGVDGSFMAVEAARAGSVPASPGPEQDAAGISFAASPSPARGGAGAAFPPGSALRPQRISFGGVEIGREDGRRLSLLDDSAAGGLGSLAALLGVEKAIALSDVNMAAEAFSLPTFDLVAPDVTAFSSDDVKRLLTVKPAPVPSPKRERPSPARAAAAAADDAAAAAVGVPEALGSPAAGVKRRREPPALPSLSADSAVELSTRDMNERLRSADPLCHAKRPRLASAGHFAPLPRPAAGGAAPRVGEPREYDGDALVSLAEANPAGLLRLDPLRGAAALAPAAAAVAAAATNAVPASYAYDARIAALMRAADAEAEAEAAAGAGVWAGADDAAGRFPESRSDLSVRSLGDDAAGLPSDESMLEDGLVDAARVPGALDESDLPFHDQYPPADESGAFDAGALDASGIVAGVDMGVPTVSAPTIDYRLHAFGTGAPGVPSPTSAAEAAAAAASAAGQPLRTPKWLERVRAPAAFGELIEYEVEAAAALARRQARARNRELLDEAADDADACAAATAAAEAEERVEAGRARARAAALAFTTMLHLAAAEKAGVHQEESYGKILVNLA